MNIIKNADIARKYRVSRSAVTVWVQNALVGKNNIQTTEIDGKFFVLDNAHNSSELNSLAEEGRKHRSKESHAEIEPKPEFYKIFNEQEIVQIIRDLEVRKEINFKFSYKDKGATYWDNFYNKTTEDGSYSAKKIDDLLEHSLDLILQKINSSYFLNIIELGPGNAKPTKSFIATLKATNRLKNYIAIDISQEMLDICEKNINDWFPDLNFIGYVADIERTKFDQVFFQHSDEKVVNIVLDVGGTIGNHRDTFEALSNISTGLSSKDLFVLTNEIDLESSRTTFSYFRTSESTLQDTLVPSMLNLDVEEMILSNRFDELSNSRLETIKLDKDYSIKFKTQGKEIVLNFNKDEEITIWRHFRSNINNLFEDLNKSRLKLIGLNIETKYTHFLAICQPNK